MRACAPRVSHGVGQYLTFSEQLREIDLHVGRFERRVNEDTPEVAHMT